jgi:hypothetical protein
MDTPEQISKPKLLPPEEYDRLSYTQLMEMASECVKTQSNLNKYGYDLQRQLTRVLKELDKKSKNKEKVAHAATQLAKPDMEIVEVFHPTRLSGLW